MDGAGRQHYLAGHDRLEPLVHQLDADKRPRDRYATESARLLGVLDERLAGRDWVMGADYSIADIRCSARCATSSAFYEAREFLGFDRFLHVQAWLDRGPAVQGRLQVTAVKGRFACGRIDVARGDPRTDTSARLQAAGQ